MLFIKNINLSKTKIKLNCLEGNMTTSVNNKSDWNVVEIPANRAEIFIELLTDEWRPSNNCNRGFWKAAVRSTKQKADEMGLNISSMRHYYEANTGLFFDSFGELYNYFWELYDNFTKNKRQVIKTYI